MNNSNLLAQHGYPLMGHIPLEEINQRAREANKLLGDRAPADDLAVFLYGYWEGVRDERHAWLDKAKSRYEV